MALAYRTSAVGGNTTSGTNPTVAITPAANDLFLVFCQAVGNTNTSPTCADGNTGGTYTLLFTAQSNSSANTLSCFVRNALVPNTTSTTVTVTIGAHTATEVCVVAVSGAPVAGLVSILRYGTQANQAASTTPAPALSGTVIAGDLILSAVGNATNPAGVTVSANSVYFNWTRNQNVGQTACGLGVETAVAQGTPASPTITWGSTSASVYASCAVEVCSTAVNAGVNASKFVSYGVLTPPVGVDASKVVAYGVLTPPKGVNVSKLVAYAVLNAINTNPPVWPSIIPPTGYVGNPYSLNWDLTPAASPTTYTLASGSLPPGLTLNSLSDDLGSITGTPTTVGIYSFVVLATNAYGTASEPMTITISTPAGAGGSFTYVN